MYGLEELFEGFLELDQVTTNENGDCCLAILFPEKDLEKWPVDVELLLSGTSLVWSNDKVETLYPFFLNFGIRFYIIRDGRDVINSWIHFTTQEHFRKFYPAYKIDDPVKVYNLNEGKVFAKYVAQWKEHIESYLAYREHFVEIRYEKLKNFGDDFIKILKIFGLENCKEEFIKECSFENVKKRSPLHLRKGKVGDWKNFFTEKHKEIFKEIAGETLIELGYEKDFNW
jgi:hypothetical protein